MVTKMGPPLGTPPGGGPIFVTIFESTWCLGAPTLPLAPRGEKTFMAPIGVIKEPPFVLNTLSNPIPTPPLFLLGGGIKG